MYLRHSYRDGYYELSLKLAELELAELKLAELKLAELKLAELKLGGLMWKYWMNCWLSCIF